MARTVHTALHSSAEPRGLARAWWPKTLWRSRRRSPAEAMHDRTHERGALIGRKDRDRVDVQADEEEESHDDNAPWS